MIDNRIGRLACTSFKTRLQNPQVMHVALKTTLNRERMRFRFEHFDGCVVECSQPRQSPHLFVMLPAQSYLRPEQRREKEKR